jgi:radical SAM protein with 4Fe4S-binding SPASM domain
MIDKLMAVAKQYHPVNVAIELTEQCNGSCPYCYLGVAHKTNRKTSLKTEEIYSIIDILDDNGILEITLTGGEPFIRRDIIDILYYIIQKNFFRLNIKTNGTLISRRHLNFIIKNKKYFGGFEFSIFSHKPAIHDQYMGLPGSLDKIISVAEILKDEGIITTFSLNIFEFNADTFFKSKKIFTDMGFNVITAITKLIPDKIVDKEVKNSTSKEFFKKTLKGLPAEELEIRKKKLRESMAKKPVYGNKLCIGRLKGIMIDCVGNIHPCIGFRHFIIGNILKDQRPLPEILKSSKIYNKIRKFRKSEIATCRNCKFINYCKPCLGAVHTEHGNINSANKFLCNYVNALYSLVKDETKINLNNVTQDTPGNNIENDILKQLKNPCVHL